MIIFSPDLYDLGVELNFDHLRIHTPLVSTKKPKTKEGYGNLPITSAG